MATEKDVRLDRATLPVALLWSLLVGCVLGTATVVAYLTKLDARVAAVQDAQDRQWTYAEMNAWVLLANARTNAGLPDPSTVRR